MAMDIELRNQLGALTAQVQELTKQSKNLDSTLAGALNNGAKSAGGLVAGTRAARVEMTMAEQVSTRIGRAWASQMFSLATGAVGVTALWQTVTDQINQAMERAEKRAKSVRDFADKSRPAAPPTILPELRKAIRGTSPAMAPDDQAEALKSYLTAGGSANENEVSRLGQVVNAAGLLGFDSKELSSQYAKLRKLGVRNPEDVIMAMTKQGKAGEIDKMKGGQAQAIAAKNQGVWNRAVTDSRNLTPVDYEAWRSKTQAAEEANQELNKGNDAIMRRDRMRTLEDRAGILARGGIKGPFGIGLGMKGRQQLAKAFPGMNDQQIEAAIDAELRDKGVDTSRVQKWLPQPIDNISDPANPGAVEVNPAASVPTAAPPPHWGQTVRKLQPPSAARAPVMEVRIVDDSRPVPTNAGD
jgi:hypothetical protein